MDKFKDTIEDLLAFLKENMSDKESLFYVNKSEFLKNIRNHFKNTSDNLSAIIQVISQDSFNLEGLGRLEYMIMMSKKVKENDMTEHDASVAVGQRLVDDIVKPQLDK